MRTALLLALLNSSANRPTAAFDFRQGLLDPRVTYTHTNANRWGFDSAGVLQNLAATTPQFDYGEFGGGALRGLRIDPSLVNSVLWNCDATNAAWTKSSMTAAKDATGPDGVANSASTLTATGANGKITQAVTLASTSRPFSVFLKRKTGTGTIKLTMDDGSTSTDVTAQVNSSTWTRVSMKQTLANPTLGIILGTSGDEVYFFAAQIDGSTFPLDYPSTPVLTTSAAVTRPADFVIVSGANFSSWFRADEGTMIGDFIFDAALDGTSPQRRTLFDITDGTTSERAIVWAAQAAGVSNFMYGQVSDGGSNVVLSSTGARASGGVTQRLGIAYKANDTQVAYNGNVATADTSCTMPTVDRVRFGVNVGGTEGLASVLQRIRYWNRRLTAAELQAYTAL